MCFNGDYLGGVDEGLAMGGGYGGGNPTWQSFQLMCFNNCDIFHVKLRLL